MSKNNGLGDTKSVLVNEVRIQGNISSDFIEVILDGFYNLVKFTIKTGDTQIRCIADDVMATQIQDLCTTGLDILIVGSLVQLPGDTFRGNYVRCDTVYYTGAEGYLSTIGV